MNRKSQRLAARTAPPDKVNEDNDLDLDKRESVSDNVGVSDIVGEGSSTVIPVDIGVEDGVVTLSASSSSSSSDAVVCDVVVDVVTEEAVPLVRRGYDVVGDAETEVVGGGEDLLEDVVAEENNERRGRLKNKGEDMAERYHHHCHYH